MGVRFSYHSEIWSWGLCYLLTRLRTNLSEIWIKIWTFFIENVRVFFNVACKMAAILSRPQCVKWIIISCMVTGSKRETCTLFITGLKYNLIKNWVYAVYHVKLSYKPFDDVDNIGVKTHLVIAPIIIIILSLSWSLSLYLLLWLIWLLSLSLHLSLSIIIIIIVISIVSSASLWLSLSLSLSSQLVIVVIHDKNNMSTNGNGGKKPQWLMRHIFATLVVDSN